MVVLLAYRQAFDFYNFKLNFCIKWTWKESMMDMKKYEQIQIKNKNFDTIVFRNNKL